MGKDVDKDKSEDSEAWRGGGGEGESDKVDDVVRCVTVTLRVTVTENGKMRNPCIPLK